MDWNFKILCEDAGLDIANPNEPFLKLRRSHNDKVRDKYFGGISHVWRGGKRIPVLKIMQTNICRLNCKYCANRKDANIKRATIQPNKLADTFNKMYRAQLVEGLFLTSGICNDADWTMDLMLQTIKIIRLKYNFQGYIHMKLIPGASDEAIRQATLYASRVSVNFESSTEDTLRNIAPDKSIYRDDLPILNVVQKEIVRDEGRKLVVPGGISTQFVVGASSETDQNLINAVDWLYSKYDLRRAYYSSFSPIIGTPFENRHPTPVKRIHRLYQADSLIRFYGFKSEDIFFDNTGKLPEELDPKALYAKKHPELFPIEVNTASQEQLIKVPGIGPLGAKRIIEIRQQHKLKDVWQLKKIGVQTKNALDFILINGKSGRSFEPYLF